MRWPWRQGTIRSGRYSLVLLCSIPKFSRLRVTNQPDIRELKRPRRPRQWRHKKKQLFFWAKQQLCTLFSTILWPPLLDYDVKPPNATFYGGREHTTTNIPFSFWSWIKARKNSIAYIWQIERVLKFERTKFIPHPLATILLPSSLSSLRKLPINSVHLLFEVWVTRGGGGLGVNDWRSRGKIFQVPKGYWRQKQ